MKWLRWLPAVAWMGVIFFLSAQTGDEIAGILVYFPSLPDLNYGHLVLYFVLAITYYYALYPLHRNRFFNLAIVLLCFMYGLTDELHQIFVPGRTADWFDIMNDTIGASVGVFVSHLIINWRTKKA